MSVQPFDSTLPEDHIDNFYMEREWRKLGNVYFKLNPEVVSTICVPTDYVDDLKSEFPAYADRIVDTFSMI